MTHMPMTLPHRMLAKHETSCGHSSTFTELGDGRILHVAGGGGSWKNYSEDGGLTWTPMREQKLVDTNGDIVNGSSLARLSGSNSIGLVGTRPDSNGPTTHAAGIRRRPDRPANHLVFWRSDDGGQTWQPPVQMTCSGINVCALQDVLLRTSSGRLVMPAYVSMGQVSGPANRPIPSCGKLVRNQWVSTSAHFFDPHFCFVFVVYSDDEGRSWHRNGDGDLMILHDWATTFSYVNEPSVTEVAPGRLLMFMRTGLGRLFQAWSHDNGETWTRPQATCLAATTTPAQIRTLPTGHLLCVWNQESHEEVKRGYNRTRLSSAISRNGGSVWEFFQNVQSLHETTRVEPGPVEPVHPTEYHFESGQSAPERPAQLIATAESHGRWSYPSVLVLKDRVLITHTYSLYQDDPVCAQLIPRELGKDGPRFDQILKVLPLKWFYGGKEPASNPFLKEAYEPAKP